MQDVATPNLTPELKTIALAALNAYLRAPALPDGRTPIEVEAELDQKRAHVIENRLKPLLAGYLAGSVSVADFKRHIDGINKQNPLWGFGGIKGQMFFNMLIKTAEDTSEFDGQLKTVVREPLNEQEAIACLRNFKSYVTQSGQRFLDAGGDSHSRPNPGSIPFFVSFFWQVQRRELWPVYYTNTIQMIESMNLWQATGDVGDDYVAYKRLHEMLIQLFSGTAGRTFSLYDVEHVFWFKSGKLLADNATTHSESKNATQNLSEKTSNQNEIGQSTSTLIAQAATLPESYVPPIVVIIPRLASNDVELQEAARRSGTTLDRAFEKGVNAAFTILGFETRLLGQGMGRVPDGQAIAVDESYAILWDTKARTDGYRMGTDDRAIRQYIDTQSRALKRGRGVRKIYYLIISSSFSDDFDDLIRSLKMETNVDEVCLVEAAALVAIVDQKLRGPLSVGLGSDGIQRLFSSSGRVTANEVLESLG
jgi:hypothetical protein